MTKSRQDFHRNAEEFAQKHRRRATKILEIRGEKSTRFQPAARQNLVEEGQKSIH